MKCIVPLAGPDLASDRYGLRPLIMIEGTPLLGFTVGRRAWAPTLKGEDYTFVVREVGGIETLIAFICGNWPGARIVKLPVVTGGALFSVLAGLAYAESSRPLVIDLADIAFTGAGCLPEAKWPDGVGGIVPCFQSNEPAYSYIRRVAGEVVETAEKRVISNEASAGVYAFSTASTFLAAAAHSLNNREVLAHDGGLFVCPVMNGVLAQGLRVLAPDAGEVISISKTLHQRL